MKRTVCLALVLSFWLSAAAIAGELVIVNSSVSVTALDLDALKNIYLGNKAQWSDGTKIIPVMLERGPVHESFVKNVVGKSLAQFSSHWQQAIFTGKGQPPKSFATEAELVSYVAQTKGAIGYIGPSTDHGGVKVVDLK